MTYLQQAPSDVQSIVAALQTGIAATLGPDLVGLYLTGSLTYGDFDVGSSDIDYLAVLDRPLTSDQRAGLIALHSRLGTEYPIWSERIEGSYVTRAMLASIDPPPEPRPYVNHGAFWDPDPAYGSEWLINRHVLQACSLPLAGPPFSTLVPPISIELVRQASDRDLFLEWLPQVDAPELLPDSHHQAYVCLTMCRILHRHFKQDVVSKRGAATWVRQRVDPHWQALIDDALQWRHGVVLQRSDDVRAFVRFTSTVLAGDTSLRIDGQKAGTEGQLAAKPRLHND